jgi:hypothetical protein
LTFDPEIPRLLTGISIFNTITIKVIELVQFEVSVTTLEEPFDGNIFCEAIKKIDIMAASYKDMHLHFNDNCSCLMVFKRINQ